MSKIGLPLGVGVVGADPSGRGFGARAHLPAIQQSRILRLAAISTSRAETAKSAAERWDAPAWFDDHRALVQAPGVDLVTVAVRVRSHRPIVEAALREGRHVYCEWPLGLSAVEGEALASLAREAGVVTGVGNQGRFSPGVQRAQAVLADGGIGRVLSFRATQTLRRFPVHADRWWLAHEAEASGALQVATAHVTDTVRALLGEFESISAIRAVQRPSDRYADTSEPFEWSASDTVAYVARLESGAVGSVHVTNTATVPGGFRLEIQGEEGQLELSSPTYVSFSPVRVLIGRDGDNSLTDLEVDDPDAGRTGEAYAPANVRRALEGLARAAVEGTRFRPDFDDALVLHRIIEAIARSSDEGRKVDLRTVD